MVRLPVTFVAVTLVLAKFIAGYFETSNHFASFRSLSRMSIPVLIVFTSTFTSKEELEGFAASHFILPFNPWNSPFVLIPKFFMAKVTESVLSTGLKSGKEKEKNATGTRRSKYFFIKVLFINELNER